MGGNRVGDVYMFSFVGGSLLCILVSSWVAYLCDELNVGYPPFLCILKDLMMGET
jgi:hypothetical protein